MTIVEMVTASVMGGMAAFVLLRIWLEGGENHGE